MSTMELLMTINRLMQACDALNTERSTTAVCMEILLELPSVRESLKKAAPEPWLVSAELRALCSGQSATWCITPKGFSLGEGLLLEAKAGLWADSHGPETSPRAKGETLILNGKPVSIDAVRDAVAALGEASALPPVLYFGPLESVGHHLRAPNGRMVTQRNVGEHGFAKQYRDKSYFGLALCADLDGGYVPQECGQVEGCAALTHEAGMTVLGIWDRSIDTRPGSHSTYIAVGTYDFPTMCKLCKVVFPKRWAMLADRVQIKLVTSQAGNQQ